MKRVAISIGINAVVFFLTITLRDDMDTAMQIVYALMGVGLLMSTIGALVYRETRRRAPGIVAIIGFVFFVPIGLIGLDAMRKLMRQDRSETADRSTIEASTSPVNRYALFFMLGFMLLITVIVGVQSPYFFSALNMRNVFVVQVFPLWAIAIAVVLTTMANGPDLSIGAQVGLASVLIGLGASGSGSWVTGLIGALVVCTLIGVFNGVFIVYLRIPSAVFTIVVSMIIYGVALSVSQIPIQASGLPQFAGTGIQIVTMILVCGALIVLSEKTHLTASTTPEKTDAPRRSIRLLFSVLTSVMSVIAGLWLLSRVRVAAPGAGNGYEIFVLFVFATAMGSTLLAPGWVAVLYALVPAVLWSLVNNAITLLNFDAYRIMIIQGGITLVFLVCAAAFNGKNLRRIVSGGAGESDER